ncbi:MAG: cobalamin biosynthesis protein [Cellvibrionaceae bacterium]|nr:cobalamin biosynthesis protein [Cellvibrionaceae bacterium]
MNKPIRIIALTDAGKNLADCLLRYMPEADLWFKPKPFAETVQQAFRRGDALLMVCATGIAVRTLAPVIDNKYHDPPVLVLDEQGQFVIPLLSGHQGGANTWAGEVAEQLQAQLVVTTAKPYLRPIYTVGMGCERGCPQADLQTLFNHCLVEAKVSQQQIASINSIDVKADEPGLMSLAASLNIAYQTFDKQALAKVEHLLSVKSDYVFATVGVYGVAESAALWAAQQATAQAAELVVNKVKTRKATCAIARSYSGTIANNKSG